MKKFKALLGLAVGLIIGLVIGSMATSSFEINADEAVQTEVKHEAKHKAQQEETKSEVAQQEETTNEDIAFKVEKNNTFSKTVTHEQEKMHEKTEIKESSLANVTFETKQNEHHETTTKETDYTEDFNDFDEIHSVRTEGDLIGTILAFEIYEEEGATDVLVEFENGEKFSFTDWYSPKLVVGEKRLIHFISFDYGKDGTETYYYILDNGDTTEKKYEAVETVYSSAIIQSIQAIQGSDYNEKEFTLALADGTKALANFFAPEEEFTELGLIEGASVNVVIYKSFNVAGELAKKEVYFNFANEEDATNTTTIKATTDSTDSTTGEVTNDTVNTTTIEATTDSTDSTTSEVTNDTVNTTGEAKTNTTTDEAMTDTVNTTDEAMTDTVNTTGEVNRDIIYN